MITISRYIKRYKDPYARPARYSNCTIFIWDNNKGGRKEYQCGVFYKSWKHFSETMKKRHGSELMIDLTKPWVLYQ